MENGKFPQFSRVKAELDYGQALMQWRLEVVILCHVCLLL